MFSKGGRTITVKKADLIIILRKNKENHIKEYAEAVEAYKKEAAKQLKEQLKNLEEGGLNIKLNLIKPINSEENYDSIIQMFEWEVNKEVELTQDEFKEYVQDKTDFSTRAKLANYTYLANN